MKRPAQGEGEHCLGKMFQLHYLRTQALEIRHQREWWAFIFLLFREKKLRGEKGGKSIKVYESTIYSYTMCSFLPSKTLLGNINLGGWGIPHRQYNK